MSAGTKIVIDQLLAGFAPNDAISNYARRLRRLFESWGCRSRILVEQSCLDPSLKNEACPFGNERNEDGRRILIYHFSIGSPATDYYLSAPGRRALIYHNITPPDFFWSFQPATAMLLESGRKQLRNLAGATELALADSRYNLRELEAAGFRPGAVLPLELDTGALRVSPSRKILRRLGKTGDHVLFVGRIAPNKKLEDLIRFFGYYRRHHRPGARLILVGRYRPTDLYYGYLRSLVRELALEGAVFAGQVPQEEIVAYYRRAGIFVSMSEHEGFGLPLLEAMFLGVPVMAYAAAAVPETMGGAGVLFTRKDYPALAEMASMLVEDEKLRGAILEGQRKRVDSYLSNSTADALKAALGPWLETGA